MRIARLAIAVSDRPMEEDGSCSIHDGTVENPVFNANSTEHIESKVEQKKWKIVLEAIVTAVAWIYILIYWAFMVVNIIRDLLGYEIKDFWIYTHHTVHMTEHYFVVLFIAILIEIVVLIFWKEYNYLRFGKLKRRKF